MAQRVARENDYNVWRANFGTSLNGFGTAVNTTNAFASVPEPDVSMLFAMAAIFPLFHRLARLRVERAQVLHGRRQLVS